RGGRGGRGGPSFTTGAGPDSQYYRNSPAAGADDNVATKSTEPGGPCEPGDDKCREDREAERLAALKCNDDAGYWFNQGEAEMSIGQTYKARTRFRRAMSIGRVCGSQFAVLASKRLAALNLSCEYSRESLARIERDYALRQSRRGETRDNGEPEGEGGAIIDLPSRQRALRALGHYDGNIDGKYGPMSRDAVRRFQREYGFTETGDLTGVETVYLICGAAQNANDLKSINTLGIMYMAGLGVNQNIDTGLFWLKRAADRGSSDAMFNLSLIYGSGTVASSYYLCGLVQDVRIADSYLQQASDAGHPAARKLLEMFRTDAPSVRWRKIRDEMKVNDFYRQRMLPVGEGCTPNPAPAGAGN
ncbi:MAG: peptidoglycan-binding protein, partial [Pseudomonadota bacterium]